MIFNKEISKALARNRATVSVIDNGELVERVAVKAFGSRAGRFSYWGIIFDKPLSDGSVGVTYDFIKAVS